MRELRDLPHFYLDFLQIQLESREHAHANLNPFAFIYKFYVIFSSIFEL